MAQPVNQTDAQGKKHGLWKRYYDNGELRYEGVFDHGVEQDTFKFYFDDGELKAKNYFRGKGVVYSWQYGGDDKLAAEGKYIDKKRDSVWTFYDVDGNIVSRETFENDVLEGVVYTYFPGEKIMEEVHYVNGVKQGEWKQFYETGRPKAKGAYKNGHLEGEVIYYEPTGKLSAKGHYTKGLMHGKWYYFDENNKIEKTQVWRYGIMESQDPPVEEPKKELEEIEPVEGLKQSNTDGTGSGRIKRGR